MRSPCLLSGAWSGPGDAVSAVHGVQTPRCCWRPLLALRFSLQTETLSSHRGCSSAVWLQFPFPPSAGLADRLLSFYHCDWHRPCSHLCFYTCCAAENNCWFESSAESGSRLSRGTQRTSSQQRPLGISKPAVPKGMGFEYCDLLNRLLSSHRTGAQ